MTGRLIDRCWEDFVSTVQKRLRKIQNVYPNYVLSEETFRLDFGYALSSCLGSTTDVFAEFPCHKSPSQKLDLYVRGEVEHCFEVKFLRQIPSGKNPPYTQHFGAVLADFLKLKDLTNPDCRKYMILVVDRAFENHLIGQGLPLNKVGVRTFYYVDLEGLQKTASKEITKRLGADVPLETEIFLTTVGRDQVEGLLARLILIE